MMQLKNYIDGAFAAPSNGRYLDNYEPATGKVYSLIPDPALLLRPKGPSRNGRA